MKRVKAMLNCKQFFHHVPTPVYIVIFSLRHAHPMQVFGREEPRAGTRAFFYGKSHLYWGSDRPQTHMAFHPRSEERGILAFSRNQNNK
jgi:hypothetical protein